IVIAVPGLTGALADACLVEGEAWGADDAPRGDGVIDGALAVGRRGREEDCDGLGPRLADAAIAGARHDGCEAEQPPRVADGRLLHDEAAHGEPHDVRGRDAERADEGPE